MQNKFCDYIHSKMGNHNINLILLEKRRTATDLTTAYTVINNLLHSPKLLPTIYFQIPFRFTITRSNWLLPIRFNRTNSDFNSPLTRFSLEIKQVVLDTDINNKKTSFAKFKN